MKEKFKRLFASIAAIILALGMMGANAIPAMAANKGDVTVKAEQGQTLNSINLDTYNGTGFNKDKTIKITTPSGLADTDTVTYTIYKVFNANSNGSGVSYSKLNDSQTLPIYNTGNATTATEKFDVDAAGNIKYYTRTDTSTNTWTENEDSDTRLSESMISQFNSLAENNSFTKIGTIAITGASQSGVAQLADYGYYYITSTTGSVVNIDTTNKFAEITDKNNVPDVVKTEDNFTNAIGGTVNYTVEVHAKKGTTNLVFHDKLSTGLSLITKGENALSIKYKVGSTGSDVTMTDDQAETKSDIYYTKSRFEATGASDAAVTGNVKSGDNITLAFNGTFTDDTTITITYSATVTSDAVINENNNATINYGNEPSYESVPSTVYESTFKFKVNKIDGNSGALKGAQFVLSSNGELGDLTLDNYSQHTTDLIKLTEAGVVDPSTTRNNYVVAADDGTSQNALTINGLDADATGTTYYLYEVKAPDGFNKLTAPIAVKITPTFDRTDDTKVVSYKVEYKNPGSDNFETAGEVTGITTRTNVESMGDDGTTNNIPAFNVRNTSGTELPSTGGIGTTIFYVIGGVVVAGAVILLLARRRKNA